MKGGRLIALGAALLLTPPVVALAADAGSTPPWLSVQTAGGIFGETSRAVGVLADGSLLVAGEFAGTAYFPTGPGPDDSLTLTDPTFGAAGFVATLDPEGAYYTHAQGITGAFPFEVGDVAALGTRTPTTSDDTVLVTGTFEGTAYFPTGVGDDSLALGSFGNPDMFVAAMRPGGGFAWAQRVGPAISTAERAQPRAIVVAPDGTPLIVGSFDGTIDFPGSSGPIQVTTPGATNNTFVAAMNEDDSTFTWVQQVGGTVIEGYSGAVVGGATSSTSDDRLAISGYLENGTAYFPTRLPSPDDSIAVSAGVVRQMYIASMSLDDSTFDWAIATGGPGQMAPAVGGLAAAPDGSLYAVGQLGGSVSFPRGPGDDSLTVTSAGSGDAYVASVSTDDSYFEWAVTIGGTSLDKGTAVAVTPAGLPLVTGDYRGAVTLPTSSGVLALPVPTGSVNSFVAAMDVGAPTFTWAQTVRSGSGNDVTLSAAIAAIDDLTAVVAGSFRGAATFPTDTTPIPVTARGSNDAYVARLSLVTSSPIPPPLPVPASPPREVTAVGGDASALVRWSAPEASGSFPITHYLVTSQPSGRLCLAAAPALSCDVTGLANGTAYAFTVSALTGAGWSASSGPSNEVVPRAVVRPTMLISGARDGKRITVSGRTTGVSVGGLVIPWSARSLRDFASGRPVELSSDGTFDWSRRASTSVVWRVCFTSEGARSNTVTIG